MTHTRTWNRGLLLALPIAALLLSGCTAGGADAADSGADPKSGSDDSHSWQVKYAGCMQDEGIDYPEPSQDPNAAMPAFDIEALGGMDAFSAADETCRGKIGDPPAPTGADGKPLSNEEMRKEALELTTCLREQGVDIEDPTGEGGIALDNTVPSEALEACGLSGLLTSEG